MPKSISVSRRRYSILDKEPSAPSTSLPRSASDASLGYGQSDTPHPPVLQTLDDKPARPGVA